MCETLHIPVLGVAAASRPTTYSRRSRPGAATREIPVVVVSGDRDTFQLVEDPYVKVLYNRRGVSDYSLYDESRDLRAHAASRRARYPLLAALRGDTSDNLPGVPGRGGEDGGEALRPVPRLWTTSTRISTRSRRSSARTSPTYEERARNNERVMRLIRDVPLDFSLEDLTLGGWRRAEVNAFFERYEMNSMRTRIGQAHDKRVSWVTRPSMPTPLVPGVERAGTRARAGPGGLPRDGAREDEGTPIVAFSHERAAVLNADDGRDRGRRDAERVLRRAAETARVAGHDVKRALSLGRRSGRLRLRRARGRHLDHGVSASTPSAGTTNWPTWPSVSSARPT